MGTSRRDVLHHAAAGGLAWAAVGCSGCPAAAAPATREDGRGERPAEAATPIAKASEIPVGGGKIFTNRGVLISQPTAGVFKAFSATCTHQGCALSDVTGGTANCPCHGSAFRVADGSVTIGPASAPLSPRKIRVSGDWIHVV
ncbi:Rieske (2Fe-2S) protein [Streptomyces sp. NPDC059979]|uniref:Rieske (2Fe-2S) protein n=1 Tax=unclassified Streptomyces TaxID=2593676 RepID=UPI003647EE7E